MGALAYADLEKIEDTLQGMKYGDLEMDDVADILLRVVQELRAQQREVNRSAKAVASCLINGIRPD